MAGGAVVLTMFSGAPYLSNSPFSMPVQSGPKLGLEPTQATVIVPGLAVGIGAAEALAAALAAGLAEAALLPAGLADAAADAGAAEAEAGELAGLA